MDVSRWVDERLSSLEPGEDWRPDSQAAFTRLTRREKPRKRMWWMWAAMSATAAAACAVFLLVNTPAACANPLGCSQSAQTQHPRNAETPAAAIAPEPPAAASPAVASPAPAFKASGSPAAPVTCELYTDYACPHCAAFYLETAPQLNARYVETGQVRLIHRDLPLAQHRYARLAALYADAAGEAGYYQAVANKLFRTQAVWSADGDIDSQVARVVPPAAMEKVRAQVKEDPAVERSVAADEAEAREKHIERTPALLCNGHVIGPDLSIVRIEASLDAMVAPTQREQR